MRWEKEEQRSIEGCKLEAGPDKVREHASAARRQRRGFVGREG